MRLVFLLSLLQLTPFVPALDNSPSVLYANFWFKVEPMTIQEAQYGVPSRDEAIVKMLEEARFTFSGMIYGFTFGYTPGDRQRGVEDSFILEPDGKISWGSPALRVIETWEKDNLLFAKIAYALADHEGRRLEGWKSNAYVSAAGRGSAGYFEGPDNKLEAYRQAAKESIRAYLRNKVYNKPKEILGRLALTEAPRCFYESGLYVSTVKVRIQFDEITGYSLH